MIPRHYSRGQALWEITDDSPASHHFHSRCDIFAFACFCFVLNFVEFVSFVYHRRFFPPTRNVLVLMRNDRGDSSNDFNMSKDVCIQV
jgi:hypothetical protein